MTWVLNPNSLACIRSFPALTLLVCALPIHAAAEKDLDNDGTDPTRPPTMAGLSFEHVDLRNGFSNQSLFATIQAPIGSGGQTLKLRLPVSANDTTADHDYGLGDISLKYTNVLERNAAYGLVFSVELLFNTAARPALGAGINVLKLTGVYAHFLEGGAIFAPALVHSIATGGDHSRDRVNLTTVDFYYVPRLANPKLYMTFDPNLSRDWEKSRIYGGLAVTLGYRLGPMLGGRGQAYIKPQGLVGADRPVNWGIEAGFQLLNW